MACEVINECAGERAAELRNRKLTRLFSFLCRLICFVSVERHHLHLGAAAAAAAAAASAASASAAAATATSAATPQKNR